MASLIQFARQGGRLMRLSTCHSRRITPVCYSSTSNKDEDSSENKPKINPWTGRPYEKIVPLPEKDENWISYGYNLYDRSDDRWQHHMIMIGTVTIVLCGGGFVLAYMPDQKLTDWSRREAYLELYRREKYCLPLIDPNVIDPAKVDLPTDEELGETEIIV